MSTLLEKANSILAEKTTKILPENLKKNITAFGVTGTLETGAKLNIYTQLTEPTKKDGLWLKTSNTPTSIVDDENVYVGGEWNLDKMNSLTNIPMNFYHGMAASIGTDVYLFGGEGVYSSKYKYDTLTDTYTKSQETSMWMARAAVASVGTNVYLFGGTYQSQTICIYDTLTDTFTTKKTIPFYVNYGSAIAIDTNIYVFGSNETNGSSRTAAYKYDTLTETWTALTKIPIPFYLGAIASVGTDIYLFGSGYDSSGTSAYKYNILTNTWTRISSIPINFTYGSAMAIGTDIYMFKLTDVYKYDTLTDTYTKLVINIPYSFEKGSIILINGEIYLFGGEDNPKKVQVLSVLPKEYADNSIVIANNSKINRYKTKLIDTEVTNGLKYDFNDFWYATTENNTTTFDTTIEKYVGDGTTWTKIN